MECSVEGVAVTASFAPTDDTLLPVVPTSIPGKMIAIDVTQERRSRLELEKCYMAGKHEVIQHMSGGEPRCTRPLSYFTF